MMRLPIELRACLLILVLLMTSSVAAANMTQGAQIANAGNGHGAPPCASCHGVMGEGNAVAGFPRLVGLPPEYLQNQLTDFASGQRQNAMMTPIAKALSADEMASLAAYYTQLPVPTKVTPLASGTAGNTASSIGEQLANRGRWSDGVPACSSCHGQGGVGVGANFPALAGQSSLYLVNQLQAWRKGTRDAGPLGLMGGIAKKLSDAEVQAVADYFSEQTPATPGEKP
ncbi:c-type cytochrome [Acetobacter estunensis]|uniref:C-type cytochrome n=1 Tax=Acetobacter estunensis TaxID=104097 RepID=A0A967B5Z0_9PROT|nr:c-type cytochrome [Acetobacter sicerae]NHO54417.1 c-type cytochrome [Acetobacter estunensis]